MDGTRFDVISRLLARSASRREAVKGIAAVIGGGALGGVLTRRAAAQDVPPGGACTTGDDCSSGLCSQEGICYCVDPAEPLAGCPCTTGTQNPCGADTLLCCPTSDVPGGPGICTPDSIGCNPTGECTSQPGDACSTDADCCQGSCSEEGVCYCSDPARPWIGCACSTGTEAPCGGGTELCCPTGDLPGGPGICTSSMAGCEAVGPVCADPGATCSSDADCCEGSCSPDGVCYCVDPAEPMRGCSCSTGTQDPCGSDTLLCCPSGDLPGGPGICTPDRLGCEEPVGATPVPTNPEPVPSNPGTGSGVVTQLPNTGGEPGNDRAFGVLGGASMAGAAAIAASLLRRRHQEQREPAE